MACCAAGVPGAGGPGRCVCRWAAARPRAVRAACCCLWPRWCFGRRRARPPARLGVLTSFGAAPRSPPVPSGPSGALHTSGARCADDARCVGLLFGQALPPPTGTAAWPCRPGVRLPETVIAFVRSYPCGIETVIAFAGEKWVFLVHFSGAEVMLVSRLPCWGRAVVLLVSASPCCRASCAKKFALLGLMWA